MIKEGGGEMDGWVEGWMDGLREMEGEGGRWCRKKSRDIDGVVKGDWVVRERLSFWEDGRGSSSRGRA